MPSMLRVLSLPITLHSRPHRFPAVAHPFPSHISQMCNPAPCPRPALHLSAVIKDVNVEPAQSNPSLSAIFLISVIVISTQKENASEIVGIEVVETKQGVEED